MDFPQAVNFLLGNNGSALLQAEPVKREPPKLFTLPPRNDNMRRVFAYLLNRRGIDRDVLYAFVHKEMIYESADYHNAVLPDCISSRPSCAYFGSSSSCAGTQPLTVIRYSLPILLMSPIFRISG